MDTMLITVTVLSMAMAAALSAIVWRMLRVERRRSNARVVALAAMAAMAARGSDAPDRADADLPIRDAPAPVSPDDVLHRPGDATAGHSLFSEPARTSPWGARLAVMACVALVATSGVLVTLAASARPAGRRAAAPAPAAATSAPAATAGLELLALRDSAQAAASRQDGPAGLTISGVVRNPRGGATLTRVAVTAYTFDDKGGFLGSARALIDVTSLPPGDESPFMVSVPLTDAVARYRVGFRDESGRVIPHVDRRQQEPIASLRPTSDRGTW